MSRDDSQLGGTQLIMVASPASTSLHQVSRVTVILLCTPSLLFTLECTTNSTNSTNSNNVYRYQTCELVCISACKGALHTNGLSYHFSLPIERSMCILQGTLKHTYTHCRICTTLYVSKGMSADTWVLISKSDLVVSWGKLIMTLWNNTTGCEVLKTDCIKKGTSTNASVFWNVFRKTAVRWLAKWYSTIFWCWCTTFSLNCLSL